MTQLIEEIVAGVGKAADDSQILVLAVTNGFVRPAGGRFAFVFGICRIGTHIADGGNRGDFLIDQRGKGRNHFERRARLGALLDGVVHHHVALVGQDGCCLITTGDQGVQIIGGILRHGQHVTIVNIQYQKYARIG